MKDFRKKIPTWLSDNLPKILPEKAFKNFKVNDFRIKVPSGLTNEKYLKFKTKILNHNALKHCGKNTKAISNLFSNLKIDKAKLVSTISFNKKKYKKNSSFNILLKDIIQFVKNNFEDTIVKTKQKVYCFYYTSRPKRNFVNLLNKLLRINKSYTLVFSTDHWDIATMSMRGIKSCQSWTGSYRERLTGSIIDPCCAILYLTDGSKTKYGEKMLARHIVRLVENNNSY